VVLSSFTITGICVLVAVSLGACCGALLIRRGRHRRRFEPDVSLDLRL
jgi:hypothetical protein